MTCNPLTIPQATKKLSVTKKEDLNNLATLMRNLNLTQDQDISIYQIVQKQAPEVSQNMKNLEQAQSLLRNMAANKQYDETVARMLTQTIADSTANLAILQAQREFELFTMLNPAQVKHYNELMAQLSN
jgi:Spy/CpxP family protein refolding chaperone